MSTVKQSLQSHGPFVFCFAGVVFIYFISDLLLYLPLQVQTKSGASQYGDSSLPKPRKMPTKAISRHPIGSPWSVTICRGAWVAFSDSKFSVTCLFVRRSLCSRRVAVLADVTPKKKKAENPRRTIWGPSQRLPMVQGRWRQTWYTEITPAMTRHTYRGREWVTILRHYSWRYKWPGIHIFLPMPCTRICSCNCLYTICNYILYVCVSWLSRWPVSRLCDLKGCTLFSQTPICFPNTSPMHHSFCERRDNCTKIKLPTRHGKLYHTHGFHIISDRQQM